MMGESVAIIFSYRGFWTLMWANYETHRGSDLKQHKLYVFITENPVATVREYHIILKRLFLFI